MHADLPPDISLRDFGSLAPRGAVAFAARAAERALHLLAKRGPAAEFAVLAAAARAAAEVAAGEPFPDPDLVPRAYAAADALHAQAGFAGFAAAHAARAALYAAGGGPADPDAAFNEIVASSYGTTRAVLTSCTPSQERLVRAAFRADMDALVMLPPRAAVDPSERGPLGPLWPAGEPA